MGKNRFTYLMYVTVVTLVFIVGLSATAAAAIRYEAENGATNGEVENWPNASGGLAVGQLDVTGRYSQVTVNVAGAGAYTLYIRYANGGTAAQGSLYINGTHANNIGYAATGGWGAFVTAGPITVNLNAGNNTIRHQKDSGDAGAINLDYFELEGGASVTPTATPTNTPTNTPTPTITSSGILGNSAEGTVVDNTTAHYYNAFRYQDGGSFTVNKMRIRMNSAGTGRLKLAIYGDSGGNPGSFLMGT
ncbi:MAG: CBM35 domain-containing protein, partial [Bacillota bacterium]